MGPLEPASPVLPEGSDPSFAAYLAKLLISEKGYEPGTVPEAAAFADACDIVLSKTDGLTLTILGIVDAEREPQQRFEMSPEAVLAIGSACRDVYCGTVNMSRMPATIQLIEVRGSVGDADRARLAPFRKRTGVVMVGYLVDTSRGTSEATMGFLFHPLLKRIRRALAEPRKVDAELTAPREAARPPDTGRPWLTYGLLGALAAAFVLELGAPVAPPTTFLSPSVLTLLAMGGLSNPWVLDGGQWHRLFSASLLHANPVHLLMNCVSLWMVGTLLEGLVGRRWTWALFSVCSLGGAALSLALNPPETVSVGASGGVLGLFAAALVLSYRLPSADRGVAMAVLMQVLVPSLIPLAAVRAGGRIDFAAHLGGALTGALLGAFLIRTWPRSQARPPFLRAASGLALAALLAFAWAIQAAVRAYLAFVP